DLRRVARLGLRPLPTEDALALFDTAVGSGEPLLAVTPLDTSVLRNQGERAHPLLRDLVPAARRSRRTAAAGGGEDASPVTARLGGLPPAERVEGLTELVRAQVAAVLGHSDPAAVEADRAFQQMGFDSLTAVELRNQLKSATGLKLPTTLIFDYPNTTALARYLDTELFGGAMEAVAPAVTGGTDGAGGNEPLAIVGMACRYPGGVTSPDELWRLV
ncbi:phosphopantetheine-binding protein, partial [Streptomyces sp. TRM 70351]|uniref:acyl carrier protein n=1 Tax=Streptomyces sp. TRM 70351 TaxID=3116552 RepID=UPI002E7C46DC